MRYVSVDLETTDLCPDKGDIVEFGAVIDDLVNPKPYDQLPRFHSYVLPWRIDEQYRHLNAAAQEQHARYHGDAYALSMHPTIFRRIAKREAPYTYLKPDSLIYRFKAWLELNGLGTDILTGKTEPINFCGKNFASFDLNFLKKIPNWHFLDRSYRSFDPTPFFIRVGEDKALPGTSQCLRRAGLDADVPHTAIEDAVNVIKLVRYGMLIKEPADYSTVADEKQRAPSASLPPKVSGCHVTVEPKAGRLYPVVTPAK